jgi:hypothetical protein
VRHAWSQTRLYDVQIEGEIHRLFELQRMAAVPVLHLDHLDCEAPGLITLVLVDGPHPYLHQTVCQTFFHDPGKRTGVRVAIALEYVVQIPVGIQMKNGELGMTGPQGTQHRIADRVISSQHQRTAVRFQNSPDSPLDLVSGIFGGCHGVRREIALIIQSCRTEIHPELAPRIADIRPQCLPNHRGRICGTPQV